MSPQEASAEERRLDAEKEQLRAVLRTKLLSFRADAAATMSARAAARLLESRAWGPSSLLLTYLATPREVETEAINRAAIAMRIPLGVPQVHGSALRFRTMTGTEGEWTTNRFGIREPAATAPAIDVGAAEGRVVVLVPGLAFDRRGNRLGRGRGYYDRFLRPLRGKLFCVGLGFGFQLLDRIPAGPEDVGVDLVVTDDGLWEATAGG